MKILVYCQHVLGIGHFFRTVEICRHLNRHDVLLVTGGPSVDIEIPKHIRMVQLPGLRMNREFKGLFSTDGGKSLDETKAERLKQFLTLFKEEKPDLFLLELYPFGRKAFRFEIDPILEGIRNHSLPQATVLCSLRDILVERVDSEKYEKRVVETLNRHFDALLVHSDPAVTQLNETFLRVNDIKIPIHYTGYIAPTHPSDRGREILRNLNLRGNDKLIVVSAGGGKVGEDLMRAVLRAVPLMENPESVTLRMFTGPYLDPSSFDSLKTFAGPQTRIERFSRDFLSFLSAADLSISMAGYNTCMNILTAKVPALVWPFSQNQEQRMRAERLETFGYLKTLGPSDLEPKRLAKLMDRTANAVWKPEVGIDLNGSAYTAGWLATRERKKNTQWVKNE